MLAARDPRIVAFLAALDGAFAAATLGEQSAAAMERIREALEVPGEQGEPEAERRAVCDYLDEALAAASAASPQLARLVGAFGALEPSLAWKARIAGGPSASDSWPEGHANVMVVGPGGLEERSDLMIGASLMAPHVRYPDHNHGPEEVYLVLTRGRFQHGESDWFEPGAGGTLYNEPNIRHAMASDDEPLLAFWCLPGAHRH